MLVDNVNTLDGVSDLWLGKVIRGYQFEKFLSDAD